MVTIAIALIEVVSLLLSSASVFESHAMDRPLNGPVAESGRLRASTRIPEAQREAGIVRF
jgi:hypothetical protein